MALGSPIFPWSCEGKLGVLLESLQGQRDLIEACVQDLIFLSREDRDLGFAFQTPPGSQASPRGEAEDSAFLSIRDTYLLEPNEWTQGCRASSSVWREDSVLLSRPGKKRRPSSRDDGGVSWVSSGCCAHEGFLTRHDECREPARDIPLVTKVMRKGARHTQRRDRASGVPPDILEHLPPKKPESAYFIALCSHL